MHVVQIAKRPHDPQLEIEPSASFRLNLTVWAVRRRPHDAIDRWHTPTYGRVVSVVGGPIALWVSRDGFMGQQ